MKRLENNILTLLKNGVHFKNCADMRKFNPLLKSGLFWIDPDGHGIGDDPIHVYCDMANGILLITLQY